MGSAFYIGCSFLLYSTVIRGIVPTKNTLNSLLSDDRLVELKSYLDTNWSFPNGTQNQDWMHIINYYNQSPSPLVSDIIVESYVKKLMEFEVDYILSENKSFFDDIKLSPNSWHKTLSPMSNPMVYEQVVPSKQQNSTRGSKNQNIPLAFGASKQDTSVFQMLKSPQTFGEDSMAVDFKNGKFFIIADGVGGAANSQVLSRISVQAISTFLSSKSSQMSPLQLRSLIYCLQSLLMRLSHSGSTTLSFGIIDDSKHLLAAHIGDCQIFVIRGGKIVFATKEQWLQPNMPNQINSYFRIDPHSVDVYRFKLETGDLIFASSDGVVDNIFPNDLVKIIDSSSSDINALGKHLIELAIRIGNGEFGTNIPFNIKMNTSFPGKRDDTTVILLSII
jgi:PPM family protein phosphatase